MKIRYVLLALGFGAIMAGAAGAATLKGSATYRERIAVPPGAVLDVQLADISRADATAEVLSSKRYALQGVPASFELEYDEALIQPGMTYAVSAAIRSDGKLLFTTDTVYPVLSGAGRDQADLVLVQVSSGQAEQGAAPEALDETTWRLATLRGAVPDVTPLPIIKFGQAGYYGTKSACNSYRGQAEIDGRDLRFPDKIAGTLMACPAKAEEFDQAYLKALGEVATYDRDGDRLILLNGAGVPVIEFELRPS